MKVKICGITTLEDAILSIKAGADWLGFNFYPKSSRYILPETCAAITHRLAEYGYETVLVGVFVNAGQEEIESTLRIGSLHLAQLCGDEPPALFTTLGERVFKAYRQTDAVAMEKERQHFPIRKTPPALLIDSFQPGSYGGSGKTADWGLAASLAAQMPILLAGGLTPENVGAAVRQVKPWGVDVASGVEMAPGRKDPVKVASFIQAAHQI